MCINMSTGMQVVANYVAMVPNGKVFDSSLEKGHPYDIRIGTGQVCIFLQIMHPAKANQYAGFWH